VKDRVFKGSWVNRMIEAAVKPYKNFEQIIRPQNMIGEVRRIIQLMFPEFDFSWIMTVYQDIIKLFEGDFVGYRRCNTKYHDLRHTEDCTLEFARIAHGAFLNGRKLSIQGINLGIISALMHDTGYIQKVGDVRGTGAKYTRTHVDRSIEFTKRYFSIKGYPVVDYTFCKNCLHCTGLSVKIDKINFISEENELLGKILGVADLVGQMSDWNYLEKLPSLFEEYQEGNVQSYETEFDLVKETPDFWIFSQKRFQTELGNVDLYLKDHFRVRWGIDRDLDREAIEFNMSRLNYILKNFPSDYRRFLCRHNLPDQFFLPQPLDNDTLAPQEKQIN
jgi:hypothetical protein